PPPPYYLIALSLSSSPPRRSSDLLRVMILTTPPMASEPYNDDMGPRMTSMRSIACIGGNQPCSIPGPSLLGRVSREFWRLPSIRDRKSTRLNSSHVSISYAVFCLK